MNVYCFEGKINLIIGHDLIWMKFCFFFLRILYLIVVWPISSVRFHSFIQCDAIQNFKWSSQSTNGDHLISINFSVSFDSLICLSIKMSWLSFVFWFFFCGLFYMRQDMIRYNLLIRLIFFLFCFMETYRLTKCMLINYRSCQNPDG